MLKISDFDFDLPRELIADAPAACREQSRLLVMDRCTGELEHRRFADVGQYLRPGDLLVMNNSRVMRARIFGHRAQSGGKIEALLLEPYMAEPAGAGSCRWIAMCRPAKKLKAGECVIFGEGATIVKAVVVRELEEGERVLEFAVSDILPLLDVIGELPLPPYIVQRRKELGLPEVTAADAVRYQTVYARPPGSVAAPTAGLHFTPELLEGLRAAGITTAEVTLHVGAGTFKPVETDNVSDHKMHREHYHISQETSDLIRAAKAEGRRVIAVGTTTARTLEAAATPDGVGAGAGSTAIMIAPGYKWKVTDALITNFHLPRSTLLLLVSALATREHILNAYSVAVDRRYRFFSYGDAMFIR